MPITPNLSLWSPDDSDDWDLTIDLAAMAISIDEAISSGILLSATRIIGTNADRLALALPALRDGVEFYATDTRVEWLRDGSNWVTSVPGSYIIYPSSVVGGTLNSDGSVSFASAAAVSLNGVFSSRFSSYEISWFISARTGAAAEGIRLRNAGVDNSAAQYAWRRVYTSGAGFNESALGTDTSWGTITGNVRPVAKKKVTISNPSLTEFTLIHDGNGAEYDPSGSIANLLSYVGNHKVASAFDSLTFLVPTGNMTGNIRVVGLV